MASPAPSRRFSNRWDRVGESWGYISFVGTKMGWHEGHASSTHSLLAEPWSLDEYAGNRICGLTGKRESVVPPGDQRL